MESLYKSYSNVRKFPAYYISRLWEFHPWELHPDLNVFSFLSSPSFFASYFAASSRSVGGYSFLFRERESLLSFIMIHVRHKIDENFTSCWTPNIICFFRSLLSFICSFIAQCSSKTSLFQFQVIERLVHMFIIYYYRDTYQVDLLLCFHRALIF